MSAAREPQYTPSGNPSVPSSKIAREKRQEFIQSLDRPERGRFELDNCEVWYWSRSDAGLFDYSILVWQQDDVNVKGVTFDELPPVLQEHIEASRQTPKPKRTLDELEVILKESRRKRAFISGDLEAEVEDVFYKFGIFVTRGTCFTIGKHKEVSWHVQFNRAIRRVTVSFQEGIRSEWTEDVDVEFVPAWLLAYFLKEIKAHLPMDQGKARDTIAAFDGEQTIKYVERVKADRDDYVRQNVKRVSDIFGGAYDN
ncbi:MAG: hypothetical protein ACXV3E_04905 [Halobacteriota archaeon]